MIKKERNNMILEDYEIIDGDKIVISKSELEKLIIYYGQKSQKKP